MWLFDTSGFASVVAYRPNKDIKKSKHRDIAEQSADPNGWLLIRARIKADLEEIERKIGADIFIDKDASADYAHRALVTKDMWKAYLSAEVDNIDYDSHFKEVSRDRAPKNGGRYSAMMKVWSAMAGLQDVSPYSGLMSSSSTSYGSRKGPSAGSLASAGYSPGAGYSGYGSDYDYGRSGSTLSSKDEDTVSEWVSDLMQPIEEPVCFEEMVDLLKAESGNPATVPNDKMSAADDEAFEMWSQAYDLYVAGKRALTDDEIDALADEVFDGFSDVVDTK